MKSSRHHRSVILAERKAREAVKRGKGRAVDEEDIPDCVSATAQAEQDMSSQRGSAALAEKGLERREMVSRLFYAFEAQMHSMEARLKELAETAGGATSLAEIDRTVKTLASLARTFTVLTELKQAETATGEGDGENDDAGPDADALRAQLAQRLESLRAEGADQPDR